MLSSEVLLGQIGSSNKLKALPGWHPFFKFTGFRQSPNSLQIIGNIVWSGVAQFKSGRKERIWYQVAISINRSQAAVTSNFVKLVEAMMVEGLIKAGRLASAGDSGILLNWWRRKCRVAESVEWQHFDDADPIQDRINGILPRGPA